LTGQASFAKPLAMRNVVCVLALTAALLWVQVGPCAAAGPDDQVFYAVESLSRGRAVQAAEALAEVVAKDPDNAYAASRLGLVRAELGQLGPARDILDKALAARGDNLFALWTLGCLDLVQDHLQQAEARFAAMRQAEPGNARGALGLGLAAAMAGHTREAVGFLAEAQAADSQDALTRFLTGLAYWLLDAPVNARLELEAALELEPRNGRALDLLGLVYRRQGKSSLAQSAWEQSLAIKATNARARFLLSRLAQDEGLAAQLDDRPAEARRAYQRALELDRSNEAALLALASLAASAPPAARSGP
jgi:tetratricopeptide (TPR) repeat protein